MQVIEREALDALFAVLQRQNYKLIGPTVRDGAIVYDELTSTADLPAGWTDEQEGGTYRLKRRADKALFAMPLALIHGKSFSIPQRCACGRPGVIATVFKP